MELRHRVAVLSRLMRLSPAAAAIAFLTFAACDGNAGPTTTATTNPSAETAPQDRPGDVHDFGVVRHGDSVQHDFVLDLRKEFGPGWYCPGTQVDCSCARTELLLRAKDGSERPIEIQNPQSAPEEGEVLVVRTILETVRREPVDSKELTSRVVVVLQPKDAIDTTTRRAWPLQFRYRIDCPVRVRPFAALDFGRVAVSQSKAIELVLASDVADRKVTFSNATSEDPSIRVELEPRDGLTLLRATFTPSTGGDGALRALVHVETDLAPPYRLVLAATATFVPDLEAIPYPKVSLRADLRSPQPEASATTQYVLVTDHDPSRPEDFLVARLVDDQGKDASQCFAVTFEAVPGEPRSRRVHVRWTGQQSREFRGELVLAKDATRGPFLPIELVALHAEKP